jgi:hypothetical protein
LQILSVTDSVLSGTHPSTNIQAYFPLEAHWVSFAEVLARGREVGEGKTHPDLVHASY